MVTKPYEKTKAWLNQRAKEIFFVCPDEIKRYHYGIITHSDAGKHALNQYFGHWVHAYANYMMYTGAIIDMIRRVAEDETFSLQHCSKIWLEISKPPGSGNLLVTYGGQKKLGQAIDRMSRVLDTLETKGEFLELLEAFQSYVTHLYRWFHWYFPWGIGPAVFRRLSKEDVREMARLAGIRTYDNQHGMREKKIHRSNIVMSPL